MSNQFLLYGMTHSLYSGKARSYLIKQHIDFVERTAGHPSYRDIMAEIGRFIIPVMQTPDGEIVQDGVDIIDWFESRGKARRSAYPTDPVQKVISLIFEIFGGEGLLRPAMHYRWNFDDDNSDFIQNQFGLFAAPLATPEQRQEIAAKASGRMRKATQIFGVNPDTIPAVEAAYEALMGELNDHFSTYPYLLGGAPTIGDYGLYAALYAHLGRDPHPHMLMKQKAPALNRWVERMGSPTPDYPEFIDATEDLLPAGDIPDSLKVLMKRIASDYGPEVEAFTAFANEWIADNPDVKPGEPVGGEKLTRAIGQCHFEWAGQTFTAGVMPYRLYLLQRIQAAYDALTGDDKTTTDSLLSETGLMPFVTCRTTRKVGRENNREVWL